MKNVYFYKYNINKKLVYKLGIAEDSGVGSDVNSAADKAAICGVFLIPAVRLTAMKRKKPR